MGTDCKSAAFSFGGSNPPAPTKKTSVENTLVFFFCKKTKSHPRGWIRTAAARRLRPAGQKSPSGAFLAARLAETPAPTKKTSVENTPVFFFCKKPKVTPLRVDSNSCGPALAFRREKSPGGAFLAARLAETPAPTKNPRHRPCRTLSVISQAKCHLSRRARLWQCGKVSLPL